MQGLRARQGIQHNHSDLWTRKGGRFLEGLELREAPRRRLDSLLRLVDAFDEESVGPELSESAGGSALTLQLGRIPPARAS
ncbi:MAG: hypothetical protein ACRDM7_22865 [Thermoleophilaceae bacterium]